MKSPKTKIPTSPRHFLAAAQAPPAIRAPLVPRDTAGSQGVPGPIGQAGSFQAFERPVAFSVDARDLLLTNDGWLNNTGRHILVHGAIQLMNVVNGCKTAAVEFKWDAASPWISFQNLFHESRQTDGFGNGGRYHTTTPLPPEGRIRVIENSNPDCQVGALYLGNTDGQRDSPWFYTVAR